MLLLMMMMMVCGVGGVDDGDVDGGDDVVDDGGGDDDDGDDVEGQDGLWKREKDNSLDHPRSGGLVGFVRLREACASASECRLYRLEDLKAFVG